MIHDNTKKFSANSNGLIESVKLFIEDVPNQQYIVSHLRLISEIEQGIGGKTEAICTSSDGRSDFYLSYPYRIGTTKFQNTLSAGNSNGIHIITNGYNHPDYGYLAIHIGREPISQIVGGLGLPFKHHVSFEIGFSLVGEKDPISNSEIEELNRRVEKIENYLRSIERFQ